MLGVFFASRVGIGPVTRGVFEVVDRSITPFEGVLLVINCKQCGLLLNDPKYLYLLDQAAKFIEGFAHGGKASADSERKAIAWMRQYHRWEQTDRCEALNAGKPR
jgi:hypothetical protein